jgi:hypothetical protein
MNTGSLHIIKATSQQVFLKSGYFENIMPSIRRCYNSKFIPFFFKYIPGGTSPESITKSLKVVPVSFVGSEILDGAEVDLGYVHLSEIENGDGTWTLYFNPESPITGINIQNGFHQFKVEIEGVEYRSEPFMCCFTTITTTGGAFSTAFSSAFDILTRTRA